MLSNKICIIVPCYNEEKRLEGSLFIDYAKNNTYINFLFVDDCSTDNTYRVLNEIAQHFPQRMLVYKNPTNLGKAETIRKRFVEQPALNNFEYVGFWDADLSTPLSEIDWFYNFIKLFPEKNIFIGSRWLRLGSYIKRVFYRQILGRFFATLVANMLSLPVYDSQCGAKIFKQKYISLLFNEPFVSKWFFDVEILYRYRNKCGKDNTINEIYEVPLRTWIHKEGSKLKFKDFVLVPLELLKIWKKYKNAKQK